MNPSTALQAAAGKAPASRQLSFRAQGAFPPAAEPATWILRSGDRP